MTLRYVADVVLPLAIALAVMWGAWTAGKLRGFIIGVRRGAEKAHDEAWVDGFKRGAAMAIEGIQKQALEQGVLIRLIPPPVPKGEEKVN